MKKSFIIFLTFLGFAFSISAQVNYAKLVDPLMGTRGTGETGSGFTFIGATYPFGMVQFTPTYFAENKGFVINQLSGAGCPHMGNFPTIPLAGELKTSPKDLSGFKKYKALKECYAGFFSAEMEDGVMCNATVTKRTAVVQFVFPKSNDKGSVIIGTGISDSNPYNTFVKVTSPNTCEGYSIGGEFCGHWADAKYPIYFVAEFNHKAIKFGTWKEGEIIDNQLTIGGKESGAYFTFNTHEDNVVEYRISISYVSYANARENLLKDDNKGSFEIVKNATETAWNKHLGIIGVSAENPDRMKQFYTHLYHVLIHPNVFSDFNGEYLGSDFDIYKTEVGREYYTSFSGWDTYRSQCQLLAILYPKEASDMMQSRVEFAKQAGGFGKWIMANYETGVMNGDPLPIIIANSYVFGAKNFDVQTAYKYMKLGAITPGLRAQSILIRPELDNYMKMGYTSSGSVTLEYASADYAIGQFALQALNNKTDAAYFINRAQNWKKLYNPLTKWLCARDTKDGSWKKANENWTEASYKNYFWMVPFNLTSLIDTIGTDLAEKRLDSLFVKLDATYDQDWYAGGNEPDFQVPWTYNWLGKPYKTTEVVNRLFTELYNSSPSGLPGNDDLGAMGSFYVFGSIGLFPMIPGVAGFAINAPQFQKITIHLPKSDLNITGGDTRSYINTMKVNGKKHDSSWINWTEIENGGKIEYELTSNAKPKWAVKAKMPSFNAY